LRVFPGPALQRSPIGRDTSAEPVAHTAEHGGDDIVLEVQSEPIEVDPGNALNLGDSIDSVDAEPVDVERMPTVDPTAELLGTSTRRKRPARGTTGAPGRAVRAAAPRKPAPKRTSTSRRPARSKTTDG
jgi:hypothetical protein